MLERFTPTGLIRKAYSEGRGRSRFQIGINEPTGDILIWTVGPLGWWHDFQQVPPGTSFDDALNRTYIPWFYGWRDA